MTRPKVLVAGAGVGALEAALAVRERVGDIVEIEIVAPDDEFVYRAMTVAEPFGYTRAQRVPLSQLWHSHRVRHRRDAVVGVDAGAHSVTLRSGDTLGYDALVLAVGARREAWLPDAVTFSGAASVPAVREILTKLESGAATSVLFVAPPESRWTMPVYELALLTAAWCADRHVAGVQLTVSMTEEAPLAAFGESASRLVREILGNRGIRLRPDAPAAEYDAVVAMPRLVSHAIPGVPAADDGFIAVGDHGEVVGMEAVYAIGDAAAHPVKQGGLAAQQADAAADAIAHAFGRGPEPEPARAVLRGLLLTGVTPAFLRRDDDGDVVAAFDALWWPPTKVAGHFLGPYLVESHAVGKAGELEDRPVPVDPVRAAEDRIEVRRLAVSMAEADARLGDHRSARHWLQTVEWLDGALSDDLAAAAQPSGPTTGTAELTALDTTFLELEDADASAHMHIGAVLVFEGPAPTPAELVRRVNERLPALPRFRQRLDDPAVRPLHRPRWAEVLDFDPTDHVRTAALPGARSDTELLAWAGDYYSHRLDRRRPLWELVLIDGLSDGRWALATKTHHCMADGIGSLDALRLFADGAEHLPVQRHADPGHGTVERLRSALGLARHPLRTLQQTAAIAELAVRDEVLAAPDCSLNVPIGTRRRLSVARADLEELRPIRAALGGTVNDIVLAAVTAGLRELLSSRGAGPLPSTLRAMVPLDVRGGGDGPSMDNRILSLFVELPVAIEDPGERYDLVCERTEAAKGGHQAAGAAGLLGVGEWLAPVLHVPFAQALFGRRLFNLTVTNVHGPGQELRSFGSPLRDAIPILPLAAEHALGVAVLSHAGDFVLCVAADEDIVPDADVMASAMRGAIDDLHAIAAAPVR